MRTCYRNYKTIIVKVPLTSKQVKAREKRNRAKQAKKIQRIYDNDRHNKSR